MAARGKPARKKRKPRAAADCDHAIYDGSRMLGSVVGRRGVFTAKNADGKTVGKFTNANEAMRAVTAAARAAGASAPARRSA